jgi:hypothetical protein
MGVRRAFAACTKAGFVPGAFRHGRKGYTSLRIAQGAKDLGHQVGRTHTLTHRRAHAQTDRQTNRHTERNQVGRTHTLTDAHMR